MPLKRLLSRLLLMYGVGLPYHPGKWRIVETLVDSFGLQRVQSRTHIVHRNGLRFALDTQSGIDRWIYYLGTYERLDTHAMLRVLQPGCVVLDVGANIGWYTLTAARVVSSSGMVHAFEPAPEEFVRLTRNIALNGFTNVVVHAQALGDTTGQGRLTELRDAGMTRLATETDLTSRPVSITTLDAFTEAMQLNRIDFVKVDIEGAEMQFLRGGRVTLSRFQPSVMMEVHADNLAAFDSTPASLIEEMQTLGYLVYQTSRRGIDRLTRPPSGGTLINVVALPSLFGNPERVTWRNLATLSSRLNTARVPQAPSKGY